MTADANKAEAQVCMDRARDAIRAGDTEKAVRMLNKAKKLNPVQDINYLLKKARTMGTQRESSSQDSPDRSYAHDDHYEETELRSRKPRRSSPKAHVQSSPNLQAQANGSTQRNKSRSRSAPRLGVDYTEKQAKLVERIRHSKDYYDILQVPKDAHDDLIKKEYRKLALQLHPDKCRAPHATEAFKALGNAYAVLSNKDKRQQYDTYGNDSPQTQRRGDYFEYDYGRGFESDFTPEEIFNMFFGNGFPSESVNRRRAHFHHQQQHHAQQNARDESPYTPLLQLFPLIAMLVLGLLAQFMVSDPPFSLQMSNKYPVRRETTELKVPYFVKHDFLQQYKGRVKQVENQVEDDYIQQLRMQCYKETNQKETMIYRARLYNDLDLLRRSEKMQMPACDKLRVIYGH